MNPPSQPAKPGQDPSSWHSASLSPSPVTQMPNVSIADPSASLLQPSSSFHHHHNHPNRPSLPSHLSGSTAVHPRPRPQPPHHNHHHHHHPPPPPSQQQHHQPNMATLTPQHPDMYHLPAPHEMYRGPPPSEHYRAQAPPSHHHHPHPPASQAAPHLTYAQHHPAPRQRTAIACRYCRRRKIRCSGFDASEDGRCSNCQRFQQECIFTPVSAQTQAFVPAHALWRGSGQSPQLYGAYGQPLPAQHPPEHYGAGQAQLVHQAPYPANSNVPYPASAAQYQPGVVVAPPGHALQPVHPYDDPNRDINRQRAAAESHASTLLPPKPGLTASHPIVQGRHGEYMYPDPSGMATSSTVSPASSGSPHPIQQPVMPQPGQQPYYASQLGAPLPAGRSPPQSSSPFVYDRAHSSASPHGHPALSSAGPGIGGAYQPPTPDDAMSRADGRTPDSAVRQQQQIGTRSGIPIRDIVSEQSGSGGRSAADSNMLNALNRRPM